MISVYLNLGSNMGDRHALIEQAVALIVEAYPEAILRRSPLVESESWGYASPRPFLNLGIALDFERFPDPFEMLHTLQGVERLVGKMPHRNSDGSYRDREIDIDIIAIDHMRVDTPELKIPHPRASQREFVLEPLKFLGGVL